MAEQKLQAGYRYQQAFTDLSAKQEKAFIPFVMIGDPNAEQSLNIIKALIDAGADALELGIPFSDPSADGITIQMAALRAIKSDINTDICIDILAKVREYAPNIPIGLLLYGNLIFARGIDTFYADMAKVGVDSVLIADLPIRESLPFREAALKHNIAPIFIAPPNADDSTLRDVSSYSKGYTYVLSRAGVTGVDVLEEKVQTSSPAQALINTLNQYQAAPPILGFGISTPQQVKDALAAGASGAISGSAVAKIIENNLNDHKKMLAELTTFVIDMKGATK
ncbi:tryptophan synthase subunit alpha [Colwellia sp. 1_MG-2023]|uniref:tryptophan synthase subunit alpha n=1 Tax=unclassified Colwellia TaxID=196834 RepID=UPI001C09B582|nr:MULTISPECIES: tryptophan synthase subunit alpha [unclassified Colwellia]MBU2923988.1 tryptophan synthase subunit alpha [Colwellia sp. C2M11]MDO6653643.1 tryptophan synthase subunit alpha [Colwellia sp. 3_MG-2023]MDO6666576.1 tryptophan synthase subunit alpha [Colwellia sp. 2_MG-2023]MDO6691019.1 tryptophan synthase subunit alpha [Colwellia sp. 1_MG-2023]